MLKNEDEKLQKDCGQRAQNFGSSAVGSQTLLGRRRQDCVGEVRRDNQRQGLKFCPGKSWKMKFLYFCQKIQMKYFNKVMSPPFDSKISHDKEGYLRLGKQERLSEKIKGLRTAQKDRKRKYHKFTYDGSPKFVHPTKATKPQKTKACFYCVKVLLDNEPIILKVPSDAVAKDFTNEFPYLKR
ncbi:MAG: hypothetical protein K6A41_02485 [Bacteroidales bacterium]|nr:hypothetical protein [Bacteroidales bacterium]